MAGDAGGGLRLSVYAPPGRVEETKSEAAPIVLQGHRLAPQGRADDGGGEGERREENGEDGRVKRPGYVRLRENTRLSSGKRNYFSSEW